MNKARDWEISADEIQVSFDVVNLYPSIPLKEGTDIILDIITNDEELTQRTKLTIKEIKMLIELCLSKCYYLWNDMIYELEDSGPIEVFAIVKLPKMLSAGGTLEVFENKILGPDVKLFLFLFCYVANVRTQQKQSLVKTEERKKQICLPYVVLFPAVTLRRNLGMFYFFGYHQGETMRQLSQERRRLWLLNAIRHSDD